MNILRDSTLGYVARFLTRDKILPYPNEQTNYERALQFQRPAAEPAEIREPTSGVDEDVESANSIQSEKPRSNPLHCTTTSDGVVFIGWYSPDDAENPQNWSNLKRYSVGILIWWVYI